MAHNGAQDGIVADPVLLHTIHSFMSTTVREMTIAVTNTAYSALVSGQAGSIGDTEAAILSADGSLVATDESQIIHMASLPTGLRFVLHEFPLSDVVEGDVFINNDPHKGAIHSNDTMVFLPVFEDGQLQFWCAVMCHLTDLGGMAPGGMAVSATSIFAEGLVIPPWKLYSAGVRDETVLRFVAANSRQPEETVGDLVALVAGAHVGAARLKKLLHKFGAARVQSVVQELFDYAERMTRRNIAALPDGVYHGTSYVDDDGLDLDRHYQVKAEVRIDGDTMTVDLRDTSPQARGSINSSYAQSLTAATYAARCYVGRDVPVNQGMWRALHIELPLGSLVNPKFPAACNTRMAATTPSVVEAVLWALSEVRTPEIGTIAGGGVPDVHGINAVQADQYWLHWEAGWGGGGARDDRDGVDGGGTPMRGGNEAMIPVELVELSYALRCEAFRRLPDSGGPGKFRGGLGVEKTFRVLTDCSVSARTDRWLFTPAGREGGSPGAPGAYIVDVDTPAERLMPSKFAELQVAAGSTVTFRTVGGGGYGPPLERDPDLVLDDVRTERVSPERALLDYGVAVVVGPDEGFRVDVAATTAERARRAS